MIQNEEKSKEQIKAMKEVEQAGCSNDLRTGYENYYLSIEVVNKTLVMEIDGFS
ncbi:hypothetical protein SAMN02745687_00033 [Lachnospiraceae bacterium NK3A20]|nr:hypothetical protein SAMN02745687_00033 [Lachnospiraceae bacterium NK3A20]